MIRPMLLIFTQEGCPACEKALPEVEKFKSRNPMQMVLVLDADGPFADSFGVAPVRVTPMYLLKLDDRGVKHDGFMKAEQVERWMKQALEEL